MESRHIVITGVSQGLGRAMAEQFINRGHVVSGCARNRNAIDELNDRTTSHCLAAPEVELYSHVPAMSRVVSELQRMGFRLASVYLIDSTFLQDAIRSCRFRTDTP